LSTKCKIDKKTLNKNEIERLYQMYIQVQNGDKTALNGLFKQAECKHICRADEINKEYRMSHMENVLDMESMLDNEKRKQEEEWAGSVYSNVTFQFSCLNKMLNKKKKNFINKAKNTGFENGKKKKNNGHSKYYDGEYDVSDFNELMYETVIEVFNTKTDEDNCLTLDGKKNVKNPICDGVSLLENISYYASRKINKRVKNSYLDIYDMEYWGEEIGTDFSNFDKYAFETFIESGRGASRLTMYAEYLAWLKRNNVHKLFKVNACDIHAIIDTIMNNKDTFLKDKPDDNEIGFGMRLVTQEMLQEIINFRHNINIEQGNISKDLEIIEQRMLDHLFYSLNYRIGKAEESKGIYEKESERFLYELDKQAYIKIFGRTSYTIYDKSVNFVNGDANSNCDSYFRTIKKYEDLVIDIISLEKKKYDMVNLLSDNDYDLVDDKKGALFNIAYKIIAFYQKKEDEYRRNHFCGYKINGAVDWKKGYWETELCNGILKIRLFSSRKIKKPIQYNVNKGKLMVYYGCINYYFCDEEKRVCYVFPKDRRIISRTNRKHEIFMYKVS